MSVNYNTSLLTQRLQLVVNAIDAGPSNGFMNLVDSGNNVLAIFQLARPSATPVNGILAFNGLSLVDAAAPASGFAAGANFTDSNGNVVIFGLTVGGPTPDAGFDILMSPSNQITAGQTIALTAATITGH